jgi:Arc/MetJ-type ribon-helix-helix transcriptional regulator
MKTSSTTVKKSVSMPGSLWDYVEARSIREGHENISRVLRDAVDLLRGKRRAPKRKDEK